LSSAALSLPETEIEAGEHQLFVAGEEFIADTSSVSFESESEVNVEGKVLI